MNNVVGPIVSCTNGSAGPIVTTKMEMWSEFKQVTNCISLWVSLATQVWFADDAAAGSLADRLFGGNCCLP